jgi:chromosomal replication initiator protein
MSHPPSIWDGVLRRLQSELPAYALEAWILPLEVRDAPHALQLRAPSAFHRDRVAARYLPAIRDALAAELGEARPVEVALARANGHAATPPSRASAPARSPAPERSAPRLLVRTVDSHREAGGCPGAAPPSHASRPSGPAPERELQRALPYSFGTFVVGPSNALAREAALAVARGQRLAPGPVLFEGPEGVGKTHLVRAIYAEAASRSRAVYVSSETFTTELLRSIRGRDTSAFKRRFREGCELLVVEDVQFFAGKAATQLELFHTLEHLRAVGAPVVLTADRLPGDIADLDPRLRSQMASGLVAQIEPPDATLRREILRAKAAAGGVHLPDDCLERLVDAVRGSVRDLEGVLIQLVVSAALLKRGIDLDLTESALRKLCQNAAGDGPRRALDVATVLEVVSGFFNLKPADLASRSRQRSVLVPRQLAMYLSHKYTRSSLPEIGRALGRAHPAVRNAVDMVERAVLERAPLRYHVEEIAARLDQRAKGGR